MKTVSDELDNHLFSIHDREYLWKLFYPSDYQPMVPTKTPEVGEYRMYRSFEFRMNILAQATNDVLFTKNSVRNVGSYWQMLLNSEFTSDFHVYLLQKYRILQKGLLNSILSLY